MSKKITLNPSMGSNIQKSNDFAIDSPLPSTRRYSALAKMEDMLIEHWPPEYLDNEMLLTICLLIESRPGSYFWSGTASELLQVAHAHGLLLDIKAQQVGAKIKETEKLTGHPHYSKFYHSSGKKCGKDGKKKGPICHSFLSKQDDYEI